MRKRTLQRPLSFCVWGRLSLAKETAVQHKCQKAPPVKGTPTQRIQTKKAPPQQRELSCSTQLVKGSLVQRELSRSD